MKIKQFSHAFSMGYFRLLILVSCLVTISQANPKYDYENSENNFGNVEKHLNLLNKNRPPRHIVTAPNYFKVEVRSNCLETYVRLQNQLEEHLRSPVCQAEYNRLEDVVTVTEHAGPLVNYDEIDFGNEEYIY